MKGNKPVIKGNDKNNYAEILGDGNDTLLLSVNTRLNGDLLSRIGEDYLELGEVKNYSKTNELSKNLSNSILRVFGNISGFEHININGNYIRHALYGGGVLSNKGYLHSDGGDLILELNGIGNGGTLALGDTNLDNTFGSGNKSKHIKTNSAIINAHVNRNNKNDQDNPTINFDIKKNLPITESQRGQDQTTEILDSDTYNDLNDIHHSIGCRPN